MAVFDAVIPGRSVLCFVGCVNTEQEPLWLVRYLSQSDLAELLSGARVALGHAVLRARDEEEASQKLTDWLLLVLDEQAHVASVELLPPNALKRLTARQARNVCRQAVSCLPHEESSGHR